MVRRTGKLVTMRGKVLGTASGNYEAHRISLDDGDNTTAYKIHEFYAWTADTVASADGCAILSTTEEGVTDYAVAVQDAGDNRQIGWAAWINSSSSGDRDITQALLDPDNVVNEDLYIGAYTSSSTTDEVNYLIIAEKIKINLTENLYTTVRNYSQG